MEREVLGKSNYSMQTFDISFSISSISESVCYEKGYSNLGEPLNVIWRNGKYTNSSKNIYSVKDCISLCQNFDDCQWFNYDAKSDTCWLKKGKGNYKRRERDEEDLYTGHRNSSDQC